MKSRSNYSTRVELNEAQKKLEKNWGFETRSILVGQAPDPATGATIFPIYQTSTYTQAGIDDNKGYCYSRTGNPTRTAVADVLASLENGTFAAIYPSGIAAVHSVMQMFKPGDHVISSSDLYGGAHRLFNEIMTPLGLSFDFVDARDLSNIASAVKDSTRLVWLESPTNPLMRLCDIEAIVGLVKDLNKSRTEENKILIGFDNTFASPYLQRPLDWGVDIVIHSGTKYLGGHSDVLIGAIVVKDDKLATEIAYRQNATGNLAGPFDCWILMKGIKTLAIRMRQHHESCIEIAKWLEKHPKVKTIHCPVLESHPQHALYKKQMDYYNGMLSFEFDGDFETVKKLVSATQIFQLAESLGGVESLIGHPASMTHAAVPRERRLELGINDNLVRISVGIETVEDLRKDLEQAFNSVS
ncbi:MAG: PLP-dependent aspartate aminotransferase family protein [Cyanobacteria bacterium]|nr:PLP-dependent aspartate aminotransferase family protein [Cyanobacteriota bacterium]MDA1021200.1 PLP-dependent aspartate aminotransferase family protein [Cyanobacteriota bacterium]